MVVRQPSGEASDLGHHRDGNAVDDVGRILSERMRFGTSYPAANVEPYVDLLLESGLTEQNWVAISQENPRRLMG